MIDRWVSAWMQQVAFKPWHTFAALLLLCLVSLYGASRLGVDADSTKMLSPNLPDQQRAAALAEAFPQLKGAIVIVVRSDQSDAADLVVAELVRHLHDSTDVISDVYAPAVDPFLVSHGLLYQKTDEVERALTRLSASSNLLAKLRTDQSVDGFIAALDDARALARRAELGPDALDRLYDEAAQVINGQITGAPGNFGWSSILADESEARRATRLITVTPKLDFERLSPAKPALVVIQSAIQSLPSAMTTRVEIGVTGEPALRAEEMQSVLGTIGISLTLSLILVAAILWIGLRSYGRALIAFSSLLITLILTTGFAGFVIGDLNLVSVAFVVLMVGLGIDFAIHVLAHVAELRRHGTNPSEAIAVTGQRMGLALVLSAATTSVAFLAFGTTDFTGMAQLGIIGGVGVLIACAVALTFIPAALAFFPNVSGKVDAAHQSARPESRFNVLLAPAIVIILATAAIWPALSVRFEADPMGLRNPDSGSVQTFNLLAKNAETSPYRVSVLAVSHAEAEKVARRFENQEGIGAAIWLGDLVPKDQDEKLDLLDIAAPSIEYAISGTPTNLIQRNDTEADTFQTFLDALQNQNATESTTGSKALETAVTSYLAVRSPETDAKLKTALFQSFGLPTDRLEAMLSADYVEINSLPDAMRDRFINAEGTYRIEILPEDDLRNPAALEAFAAKVRSIADQAAGGPIQLSAAAASIGWAMLQATLLAGFATGLLAWFATRRLWDAVAILVPLIIAGILTAAVSTILDMPFNFANVIVLPLLIGIGVDSGIHIALRERNAPGAVFETSTPRAVLFSALTTMAAFGTLALSDHRGTASMGILLAVAMCAAVICIMALTPTVIRWTRKHT